MEGERRRVRGRERRAKCMVVSERQIDGNTVTVCLSGDASLESQTGSSLP